MTNIQDEVAAVRLPDGYAARRFDVQVGAQYQHQDGWLGWKRYKTLRGARSFSRRAADHYACPCYVTEFWLREAGWWTAGLHSEGQVSFTVEPTP